MNVVSVFFFVSEGVAGRDLDFLRAGIRIIGDHGGPGAKYATSVFMSIASVEDSPCGYPRVKTPRPGIFSLTIGSRRHLGHWLFQFFP